MAAIRNAVDVAAERLVDLMKDQRFLELSGAVGGQSVEAGRHRVPVSAKVAVHELGLVCEAAQGVTKDRRTFAGLDDAKVDLLVVEPFVLLTVRRGRSHEHCARNAACRRVPVQVRG